MDITGIATTITNYTRDTLDLLHNSESGFSKFWSVISSDWGALLGYGILGGLGAVVLPYLVLCVLGFTCWGVLAGSAAACCQSGIGDVEAGSCFACLQSVGASGYGCFVNILLFLFGFFLVIVLMIKHGMEQLDT